MGSEPDLIRSACGVHRPLRPDRSDRSLTARRRSEGQARPTLVHQGPLDNAGAHGSLLLTMVLYTIALCFTISPWGIVTSYISERFSTGVRSSGYGVGYSLAVIIPSFFSFYLLGLAKLIPYAYTPLVLLGIAGLLQIIGAFIGPETRDVALSSTTPEADHAPQQATTA